MKRYKKHTKLTIINTLLFSSLAMVNLHAEPQFDLEKEKSKLSNKLFESYDFDKDKTLSFDEFTTFSNDMKRKEETKRMEQTIKSCDKNHNDKIESTEVPTEEAMEEAFKKGFQDVEKMCHMDKMEFKEINRNDDDFITKEEILASYNRTYVDMWEETPTDMPKIDMLKDFKKQLERCDENKDREITLIEATSEVCYMTSEEFLEYSSDPEKSFTIDEVTKAPKERGINMENRFKRCDSNSDSKLNLVEATSMYCNMPSDEFIKLDSDKNNFLTNTEIKKMYDEELNDNKIPIKIFKEMPPIVQINIAINQCDENKDKKLTKDEAESCELALNIFEQYDYDKSNTIEENDIKMIQSMEEFNRIDNNNNKKLEPKEFEESLGNQCQGF